MECPIKPNAFGVICFFAIVQTNAKKSKANAQGHSKLDTTDLRPKRSPAGNSYKKFAVQLLNEALCFVLSFVVADSLVFRNPLLHQAPNR